MFYSGRGSPAACNVVYSKGFAEEPLSRAWLLILVFCVAPWPTSVQALAWRLRMVRVARSAIQSQTRLLKGVATAKT